MGMANNKLLYLVVSFLVVFVAVAFIARPSDTPIVLGESTENSLTSDTYLFDFGKISMKDGLVSHTFTLKNEATNPVMIEKIFTSCMCTKASLQINSAKLFGPFGMPGHGPLPKINVEIAPNDLFEIYVEFDPTAHGPAGIGKISRKVLIEGNQGKVLELGISAEVTP